MELNKGKEKEEIQLNISNNVSSTVDDWLNSMKKSNQNYVEEKESGFDEAGRPPRLGLGAKYIKFKPNEISEEARLKRLLKINAIKEKEKEKESKDIEKQNKIQDKFDEEKDSKASAFGNNKRKRHSDFLSSLKKKQKKKKRKTKK